MAYLGEHTLFDIKDIYTLPQPNFYRYWFLSPNNGEEFVGCHFLYTASASNVELGRGRAQYALSHQSKNTYSSLDQDVFLQSLNYSPLNN